MINTQSSVVVVGAGPTGLMLAAELALGGVDVSVLERRTEPDETVKAGSVNVATAEAFDRRGLSAAARAAQGRTMAEVARFVSAGRTSTPPGVLPGSGGRFPVPAHFAGIMLRSELVDPDDPEIRVHTAIYGATLLPQREVEAILTEHAVRLGVRIQRGVEVSGMVQDDDGVTLETSIGAVRASWVVGTDGGRSLVRKLAGIDFPGTAAETTGYQAIADLDGAEALQRGWNWTPTGVYSYGPIPGRILTVQFAGAPADRSAPVTPAELQASIRLVTGADVTVTALHGTATRWTDNARQADRYRSGRVLVAGDAAHVHSPFSGQGLNLGIGDATNLGWKLAATVQGWAPAGLLDSYHAERHPIGAWVLDWTRAQVALMRGDEKTHQLRGVVSEQIFGTREGTTNVSKLASGIAQRYTLDDAAAAAAVDLEPTPGRVGRLLADVMLADGTRLADHAHGGSFVLLDRTPDQRLGRLALPWQDRVVVVVDALDALVGEQVEPGPVGLLVRPDGVICWAAEPDEFGSGIDDGLGEARREEFTGALSRWAGSPTAPDERPV